MFVAGNSETVVYHFQQQDERHDLCMIGTFGRPQSLTLIPHHHPDWQQPDNWNRTAPTRLRLHAISLPSCPQFSMSLPQHRGTQKRQIKKKKLKLLSCIRHLLPPKRPRLSNLTSPVDNAGFRTVSSQAEITLVISFVRVIFSNFGKLPPEQQTILYNCFQRLSTPHDK